MPVRRGRRHGLEAALYAGLMAGLVAALLWVVFERADRPWRPGAEADPGRLLRGAACAFVAAFALWRGQAKPSGPVDWGEAVKIGLLATLVGHVLFFLAFYAGRLAEAWGQPRFQEVLGDLHLMLLMVPLSFIVTELLVLVPAILLTLAFAGLSRLWRRHDLGG
ncbi:hypothetical protein [Zavarzinia compransoris]|nr:hypothetical protein [Zavarzinia compransoris]TDP44329.1 hypothetical protein DES42_10794 [Zavarzinia compransoris]